MHCMAEREVMYHMDISPQKAGAIINQQSHGYWFLRRGIQSIAGEKQDSYILKTGAKLCFNGKGYHISGYAFDGSDVSPYRGSEEMHRLADLRHLAL